MFENIFHELCKGNISILDLETKQLLADSSIQFLKETEWNESKISDLKYLVMICNLLYNRTDMLVLPVEDGVYDLLLERYKTFDSNFQVGSTVVQFKDQIEKEMISHGERKIINPLVFQPQRERDEVQEFFKEKIQAFDQYQRLTYQEAFAIDPMIYHDNYIEKRTHNTKHNHPTLVGTLDKCKFVLDKDAIEKDVYEKDNVKILERDFFLPHIMKEIITEKQELEMVIELKYDGISVEADCRDTVVSARTRGDTGVGEAADITPILKGYRFPKNITLADREVGVKFEAIMTRNNLELFNRAREYNYANCRTAIIGLFGASDAYKYKDYITLVPLALDREDVPEVTNRMEEIELLNKLYSTKGEPLRYCYIHGDYKQCLYLIKKFAQEAQYARDYLGFAFDGIVVSYLDETIRERLGRENNINKYSMAVKFDPMVKLTTFLGYTYEVGQAGNICPMIHYSPVEFFGTIHPKSTGSSFNRFQQLALRPGDIIEVTYTNDVMPYVNKFDCEQNRQNQNPLCEFPKVCPVCGRELVISDSGKSAICPNMLCQGRVTARMVNMLQKLNTKGFAESTIAALQAKSLYDLFEHSKEDLIRILGPGNAENFDSAMHKLLTDPIEDYQIIGALGFTNIGSRKWKLIFQEYTLPEFVKEMYDHPDLVYEKIRAIKNLGESTASTIVKEFPYFEFDMGFIVREFNVVESKNKISKKQIRFTGCRNKQLEEQLNRMGYDASDSSVTKKTDILLVPYAGFSSTKTAKVSDSTMVIPIDEFLSNMEKYL